MTPRPSSRALSSERAEAGEEVVIARAGKPVVCLVAVATARPRRLGQWQGEVWMADDFASPLSEEDLEGWEGAR